MKKCKQVSLVLLFPQRPATHAFFDDVISRLGRHVEYSIGTKTLDVIDLIKIITKYKVRSVCLCLILES